MRRLPGLAALIVATARAPSVRAQAPALVRDITTIDNSYAAAGPGVDYAGATYLSLGTPGTGRELWRSNGTAAGTTLVKDIAPGFCSGLSDLRREIVTAGGLLFFAATDGIGQGRLWASDGTDAGTAPVMSVPGPPYDPYFLTELGGSLLFVGTGPEGRELWRSDGTDAGTFLVKDINPGRADGSPGPIQVVNGVAFFIAHDAAHGYALWRSDGTEAGTLLVVPTRLGVGRLLGELNGILFFSADDGVTGTELWATDPGGGGAHLVADLNPGPSGSSPYEALAYGGALFFTAVDDLHGFELWVSDGTATGTMLVTDLVPGPSSSSPYSLTVAGGYLFFTAADASGQRQLWWSDGSASGTHPVVGAPLPSIEPVEFQGKLHYASGDRGPSELWRVDGPPFAVTRIARLSAGPGTNGLFAAGSLLYIYGRWDSRQALWRSDGSASGTFPIVPVASNAGSLDGSWFVDAGPIAYFPAWVVAGYPGLWRTDGTEAGTFPPSAGGLPLHPSTPPILLGNQAILVASLYGSNVWAIDGSPTGATQLTDFVVGGSMPMSLTPVGSRVYFSAADSFHGIELWQTDGTHAGTGQVKDIQPGPGDSFPELLVAMGGKLYFTADDGVVGPELWTSDGTEAGTTLVKDIRPGRSPAAIPEIRVVGAHLFFPADDGLAGLELWSSDGTAAGTLPLGDFEPGPGSSRPRMLFEAAGKLFFAVTSGTSRRLWVSDGSATGTAPLLDPDPNRGDPWGFVTVAGSVYFNALDAAKGPQLWKTDGSPAGTVLLKGVNARSAVALNGRLYFVAGTANSELWTSDGTSSGTYLVQDVNPAGNDEVGSPVAFDGALYFSANDGLHGPELWRSDGTAAGTATLRDLAPGTAGSSPSSLVVSGSHLYFAWSRGVGRTDGTAAGTESYELEPQVCGYGTPAVGSSIAWDGRLLFAHDDHVHGMEPWLYPSRSTAALLRNDAITSIAPVTPPLATVFPLDPARDAYLDPFVSGDLDPSPPAGPLVLYEVPGAGRMRLARRPGGVRIEF